MLFLGYSSQEYTSYAILTELLTEFMFTMGPNWMYYILSGGRGCHTQMQLSFLHVLSMTCLPKVSWWLKWEIQHSFIIKGFIKCLCCVIQHKTTVGFDAHGWYAVRAWSGQMRAWEKKQNVESFVNCETAVCFRPIWFNLSVWFSFTFTTVLFYTMVTLQISFMVICYMCNWCHNK